MMAWISAAPAPRGNIQHHQQFDDPFADRLDQGLHDEDDPPAYAGAQLHVQVVVAVPAKAGWIERYAQIGSDIGCQPWVRLTTKYS